MKLPKYFYFRVKAKNHGTVIEVEDASDVDVVEVFRCCHCKWLQCNMSPDGQLPKGVDEYECRYWCISCDPTDFCSRGERREEE